MQPVQSVLRFMRARFDLHPKTGRIKQGELQKCSSPAIQWCHRESNQGHKDFQSFALPTELWHRLPEQRGKDIKNILFSKQ